ncbi:MAG: hypothetical protein ACI959_001308 [Limisphaerales bacterium]
MRGIPLTSDSLGYSANSRVDFIRLPNELRVQEYGSNSLPLAVEAQYQNVLGKQSVMALYFNGLKTIKNEAYLAYYAQFAFRDVYATSIFENAPWYLGRKKVMG